MTGFKVTERTSFNRWTREILRYSDLDPVGHVNNNAYGQFVENSRTALFMYAKEIARKLGAPTMSYDWVVRRIEFDYLQEVRYPGEVEVGVAITRIGNSSMVMQHGVFTDDYCAATATGVSVCFDLKTRSSTKIPKEIRNAMTDLAGV